MYTITTLGTKLKVISFIDVAACNIPIVKPTIKATNKIGPAINKICQKA
jgi:hypothetical protein